MSNGTAFQSIPTTTLGEVLSRENVMGIGIRPLWPSMPRIAGEAYTVRCAPGDSLMLHAAIYRAAPGSIIVAEAGDFDYALAGGNVCAIAQSKAIAGFIIDGVIRDLGDVRSIGFPVFARGIVPIPGRQCTLGILNGPVQCGGITVAPGDIVVADEEGVVVVPRDLRAKVLANAKRRLADEGKIPFESWKTAHQERIESMLRSKGFTD
jgi:4-hydroxy-4-methyl-2-oxoglutarate aldolase